MNGYGSPQWTPNGVSVCSTGAQYSGCLVPDGDGGAIIVWEDQRPPQYHYGIYAQRIDSLGQFLWASQGVPVCTLSYDVSLGSLAGDGSGGVYIVWDNQAIINQYKNIYAQHLNAAGSALWSSGGLAVCTAGLDQIGARAVASGEGVIFVWSDERSGTREVYAQRIDNQGNVRWADNGVRLSGSSSGQKTLYSVCGDPAGGAIAIWQIFTGSLYNIFVQKVDTLGVKLWEANGVSPSINSGSQFGPRIIADGSGGTIVSWYDFYHSNFDVFAQRIGGTGLRQWSDTGSAVCVYAGSQQYQEMASDGKGGAIIVWQDARNGNDDIYALRVRADGSMGVSEGEMTIMAPAGRMRWQCRPNPFSRYVDISCHAPNERIQRFKIYNLSGQCIRILNTEYISDGCHRARWDGRNDHGELVSAGVYLVRLEGAGVSGSARVAVVR